MQFCQIIINYQTPAMRIADPDRCLQLECPHREKPAYVSGRRHNDRRKLICFILSISGFTFQVIPYLRTMFIQTMQPSVSLIESNIPAEMFFFRSIFCCCWSVYYCHKKSFYGNNSSLQALSSCIVIIILFYPAHTENCLHYILLKDTF